MNALERKIQTLIVELILTKKRETTSKYPTKIISVVRQGGNSLKIEGLERKVYEKCIVCASCNST